MKNLFSVLFVFMFSFIFSVCTVFAQDSTLVISAEQEKNIVALAMEGEWLYELKDGENSEKQILSFQKDSTALSLVPKKFYKVLFDKPIYSAGYLSLSSEKRNITIKSVPYLLTTIYGNPHVVIFMERDGKPYDDAEGFNIFIPTTGEKEKDILYMGGDNAHEPFQPFQRVK